MLALIGQLVDRYQVTERVGEEPWGTTWKAFDPKFDRSVNLLVIDPAWGETGGSAEFALAAARVILRFRHPGIARILDIGKLVDPRSAPDTRPSWLDYLVQESLTGASLETLLDDQRGRQMWMPIGEAVLLVAELCRSIDYAHQRNIIHGALSARCIFFRDEPIGALPYQPVIAKLGFVNPDLPALIPASPYRAPEIGRGETLRPAVDIFALGVILYELLTGKTPAGFPFPRPTSERAEIPAALEAALRKALSPDPSLRYTDAGQMAAALEALQPAVQDIPATAAAGATIKLGADERVESLHAALRRSLEATQASGIAPETATRPMPIRRPDVAPDQVHILEPGKEVRSVSLKAGPMIIGRGQNADIILDLPGVSRHHSRLEFDGQEYRVTDLHSTNGTFLETTQLPPGEPTVWKAGENVRIGEVWLRLERAIQSQPTRAFVADVTRPASELPQTIPVIVTGDGRTIDSGQMTMSSRGWVGAHIENPHLVVSPGGSASANLLVINRGPMTDTFYIAFEGAPAEWLANPPQTVNLPANSDREIPLTIRPPRTSTGRAGRHQFVVRITSQNARDQIVELRLSVTITAFSEFFSELQSERLRSGQIGQVLVHNRGNLPETFTILWDDRLRELVFDPPQVRVTVPPGQTAAVEYRPTLLQPRWLGGDTAHSYKVHVSAQTGQMQTHSGEYTGRALIPPWAPIAASALCVSLVCILLLVVNQAGAPARAARNTAFVTETAIAYATRTAVDATQTAGALNSANLATQAAATATAGWGAMDADGDGLANSLEALAGTRLDHPDTDGDGLSDGDEVNRWKTRPTLQDTDGDLLQDGEEIRKGSDPLQRDTDEDGIDDGFDPDPINRPTHTPLVIQTFTPRPPTITPTIQITSADVNISISNGRSASIPGSNVVYTIQIANRGPGGVNNVAVTAAMPPNLSSVTWNCTAAPGSICQTPNGAGNVTAVVHLPLNGVAVITVNGVIAANATGQFAIVAAVAVPPGVTDPNPIDNQATDVDTLTPRVSLVLGVSDNRTSINAGQTTSYNISVLNNGPSAVSGVSLVDNFPADLTNITWSCAATAGSSCSVSGVVPGNVNTLLNLLPGGSATVTANATVRSTASGTLANTASITSPVDPLENNKSASDTTAIVSPADLALAATAPPTVTVSTLLTYTLTILNNGPAPVSAMELSTQLPPDAAFITYTLSTPGQTMLCGAATGRLVCTLGALAPGSPLQVRMVVQAPPVATLLSAAWEIRAPTTSDPNPANNLVNTGVTVLATPDPYPEPYPPP